MKYIFDFDDVLFYNTKLFKEHMYECLEEAGVSRNMAEIYYKEVREKEFSLKNFIAELFKRGKMDENKMEEIYKKIMSECKNFTNLELLEKVKGYGKENCFIVTNGEKQFQKDKLENSGITPLFQEIFIVPNSKKEVIYEICSKYKDEKISFFEDKIKFIADIDMSKCPNLETVFYKI